MKMKGIVDLLCEYLLNVEKGTRVSDPDYFWKEMKEEILQ
jgi:hypothetical protein